MLVLPCFFYATISFPLLLPSAGEFLMQDTAVKGAMEGVILEGSCEGICSIY